jgi:DNA repair and recombination protein RAD52
MGGDIITKTLNEAFGYDGWCLEVKNTTREESTKDDQGRHHVAYIATVRITHKRSGVFREDCGAGDAIDRCLANATGNALKGAVTDAMKRAARHFGEKLGNSLYHDGFNANNAPSTLKDALDTLEIDRAKSRFGFEKDRQKDATSSGIVQHVVATNSSNPPVVSTTPAQSTMPTKTINNHATNSSRSHVQQTPRTQYVGNVVMEHTNILNHGTITNHAKLPHITPHHGPATAQSMNISSGAKPTNTYVTPANRSAATFARTETTFNPSIFAAIPAEELARSSSGKENEHPPETGVPALPPRPGTSRGSLDNSSPTSAYIANYSGDGNNIGSLQPSMFGANGTISQALTNEQSKTTTTTIAQSLKRKSEEAGLNAAGGTNAAATKNPYTC